MKQFLALLLVIALTAGILAGCSDAGNANKATDPPIQVTFSGSGTEAAPYQIATAEDLRCMAKLVNAENDAYRNGYYILTADIDLGGEAWTPIGDGYLDSFKSFPGTFDGNGHAVSGLYISASEEDDINFYGLFGHVEGTIKNLTIAASTIDCSGKDSAKTGTIAGCIYYDGTIENCRVASDVSVTGSYTTGGLVGEMDGLMASCVNEASVTGTSEVGQTGGLAGLVASHSEKESSGVLKDCSNSGEVRSAGDAGGVAGTLLSGTISGASNSAAVSGEKAGGIVGTINAAQTNGTVSDYSVLGCVNSGTITATKVSGGITADVSITTGNVTVSDCSNTGALQAPDMGGIIGTSSTSTPHAALTVIDCSNTGSLENPEADGTATVGGIVASLIGKEGGTFTISGCKNTGSIDAGTGRAGGVLGTYTSAMSDEDDAVTLTINNCINEGSISSGPMGSGGIVGEVSAVSYPSLTLTVSGCTNSGDLYGKTANVRLGGIVGVIEPHHCTAVFTNCVNSGDISCENVTITAGEEWFNFSAAMGGILGYAGINGTAPDPNDDCGTGSATVITFDGCRNDGTITTANSKVDYHTDDICGLSAVGINIK